jgi:hypothetical protein
MATAFRHHAADALRRGLLLLGLIAIVAGFLGMHIMAGLHGAHAMTAMAASADSSSRFVDGPASHSATSAHDSIALAPAPDPSATAGPGLEGNHASAGPSALCVCQAECTDPASVHSACVPSAAVSTLAAPPPGTAPTSLQNPDTRGTGAVRAYAYLPGGPSPGDLSISRT